MILKLLFTFFFVGLTSRGTAAKEIALTFDDAPSSSTLHFESRARATELIKKLKALKIERAMIFANPCKGQDSTSAIGHLKRYRDAGHLIGNHTCSHPRFDTVGFEEFSKDAAKGDRLLEPLFSGQKFFRFPYLHENKNEKARDQMREWLRNNNYRNGMVSIDNDDYLFSAKINQAKKLGKKIDYKKVESLFVAHLIGAANFYEELAIKTVGYSPKHVILLHEVDATIMFLEPLVNAFRKDGWTIIGADEAYQDKVYFEQPKNTYANNGIIAQINMEKTGERIGYNHFEDVASQLNEILGLEQKKRD